MVVMDIERGFLINEYDELRNPSSVDYSIYPFHVRVGDANFIQSYNWLEFSSPLL